MTGEADVVAELHTANKSQAPDAEHLQRLEKEITRVAGNVPTGIAFRNQMNLIINKEKLLLYNVSYDELTRVLRTAFKENKVSVLRSYQQYLPISIAGEAVSYTHLWGHVRPIRHWEGTFIEVSVFPLFLTLLRTGQIMPWGMNGFLLWQMVNVIL